MDRNEAHSHKKRKSYKAAVMAGAFIAALVSAVIALLFSLFNKDLTEIFGDKNYWLTVGVVNGSLLAGFLMLYRIDAQNIALNENDLEDTEWLTVKRLKKLDEFTVTNWDGIEEKGDGIVIAAEKNGKTVQIITTSQLHALIVGTTGSGKTTGFVDQNIAVLARSKGKPTLIISDPKKELYEKHAKSLKANGYEISVLDLRQPYASARWNPMNVLIRRIKQIKELKNNYVNKDGKYYGAGEEFLSYDERRVRVQELQDEIFENAMDLVYTLCPVQNKDQPTWEEGARNLILGLVLAFCEDCISGKIDEKQLQLFNVYHNITKYCSEDTAALKKYLLEGRGEFSKVRGLVNTVLITSDKTLTSYLSEVNAYMQQLSDDGILSLTSESDLELINADEKPTAIFIIVPDERFTRHRFVTLFITQVYKELVEKANLNLRRKETATAELKRRAYFILDEFGNLPRIENMDGMITVGRSRGIRYLLVLQSFSQLNAKYGKDIADTIKGNCNIKIFIGSDDMETRKEFSELCGQKKIKNFSVNTSAENPASGNTGASNQPLITVGMLERLNGDTKGDAVVSIRGYEPIFVHFTPSYLLKGIYFTGERTEEKKECEVVLFKKENYVFDIAGDRAVSEAEKFMQAIDSDEEKENAEEVAHKKKIDELDKKWQKIADEIESELGEFSALLNGTDAKALKTASLGNKLAVLYAIMDCYNENSAKVIQQMADKVSKQLAELKALQSEAMK